MKRDKLVSIIATSLAAVVMLGALVYYNFLDRPGQKLEEGDKCPDFTVSTYQVKDGEFQTGGAPFTLSEQIGKVIVINFWATWCIPCKDELPYFNRLQETYPEDVVVMALNGAGETYTAEKLANWLTHGAANDPTPVEAEWNTYSLIFGRYETGEQDLFAAFGFSGALPSTVIVSRVGEIRYIASGSMHYEDLEREILPLL